MNHKDVDKFGKLVVDGMMLALLWAVIALPISTFSLVRLDKDGGGNEVLSAEDERLVKDLIEANKDTETKSFRPAPIEDGTEELIEIID